ncbi:glycosyltransferase family 4 protein [bacterium]|nr:MAG: glycosyltransferase family 4 protein [bacterium]
MRIAFFTNNYLPRPSGVAHAIENLRIELENLGHDVFIFAPRYSKTDKENNKLFRYKSFRIHKKLGPLRSIPFPHSPKLKKQIKELNLDIIHSHHPYLLGKTAQKYARELNIPLILSLHTPYYQYLGHLIGNFGEAIDGLLLEIVSKYANKCNAIIVPTNTVKESLNKGNIIPPIYALPSGINLDMFKNIDKKNAKKKLNIDESKIILLTVGRLSYEKNIDFLIEAFYETNKILGGRDKNLDGRNNCHKNIKFIIVGGGSQRIKLQSISKSLGLKNIIIFAGKIPYNELPLYYNASDIFLYSSLIDTQGLTLCEAMASGLPIVSTDQAMGPQSLIKNDKIGYLVKPNIKVFSQRIIKLINSKEKREKFGENAKIEAKKYDRKILAKKLEKIYMTLVKK